MHSSLDWIEWLDRLDRVLQSARSDLAVYSRTGSHSRLAMLKVAHRQLEVLLGQLQWMDPRVLVGDAPPAADDALDRLRVVIGTAVLRLSKLSGGEPREQLSTLDSALWDGHYEAVHLLEPRQLSA
jgi:hypothetical protein